MANLSLIVRAKVLRPLLTPERASRFLEACVLAAGMNVISGPFSILGTVPGNEGVSATAVLDFSSASIHEWPHRAPPEIHLDLFTCGQAPRVADFRALFSELGLIEFTGRVLDRDEFLGVT